MIYNIWYTMYDIYSNNDIQRIIYNVWYKMYDMQSTICDVWYMNDAEYSMYEIQCMVYNVDIIEIIFQWFITKFLVEKKMIYWFSVWSLELLSDSVMLILIYIHFFL